MKKLNKVDRPQTNYKETKGIEYYMFGFDYSISEKSIAHSDTLYSDPVEAWQASRGVGWYGSHGSVYIVTFTVSEDGSTIQMKRGAYHWEYHPKFKVFTKAYGYHTDIAMVQDICNQMTIQPKEEFIWKYSDGNLYIVDPCRMTVDRVYDLYSYKKSNRLANFLLTFKGGN